MEPPSLHELAAGYALDALDDDERVAFEQHLVECRQCVADVLAFRETAALLAYAEEGPELPAALRERVLEEARRELPHQSVVVLRPRRALRLTGIAAAAAVAAAIALGVWATSLSDPSTRSAARSRTAPAQRRSWPTRARDGYRSAQYGQVVRAPDGEAVMIVRNLEEAPSGKTYEAWVIGPGGPVKAGLFDGGDQEIVLLDEAVDTGEIVAVTLEPEGGSDQPTTDVLFGTSKA